MFKLMTHYTYQTQEQIWANTREKNLELTKEIASLKETIASSSILDKDYYIQKGWENGIQEGMQRRIEKAQELKVKYDRSISYLTDKIKHLESRLEALQNYSKGIK